MPEPRSPYIRNLFCLALFGLLIAGCLTGCQESAPPAPTAEQQAAKTDAETPAADPPTPPLNENFEATPQLSLFPRAGDYRPEQTDERFPYWQTFIEHIIKTSGPASVEHEESKRSWSLRSIKTIDSVGFFSPLAVEPQTSYRVSLQIKTDLAEGASAGVGILEFNEFLWIGNQFTEAEVKQHGLGTREGIRLTGSRDWGKQTFDFTTGEQTRMIHLVFFREGEHDRNPVLIDDISIAPLQ